MGALADTYQLMILIGRADASCHMAILSQGVLQDITYHRVTVFIVVLMGGEIIINLLEGMRSVIIVGVDHGEGSVDLVSAA